MKSIIIFYAFVLGSFAALLGGFYMAINADAPFWVALLVAVVTCSASLCGIGSIVQYFEDGD